MWWLLLLSLSPLWGWYIFDMSEEMVARADFMLEQGLQVSPSIDIFRNLGWKEVLGVGSILGLLFYALPIALVLSLFESLARSFEQRKIKWIIRLLSMSWILTPLGSGILAFSESTFLSGLIVIVCMLLCFSCARFFESLAQKTTKVSWKIQIITIIMMLLCVSHFLTNPVLHLIVKKESYEKVNPMTIVRDWLLLDNKSSNWVNSWYYGHSPIAMEREKITVFQPMVVGLIDIDEKVWKRRLSSFFVTQKKDQGTKIKFIQLNHQQNIESFLNKEFVHFVAIGEQHYESFKEKVHYWPQYSYAFFGLKPSSNIPKELYVTPQNYYGKGYSLKETPVLKRKDFLQDNGVNVFQSETNTHFKRGLGFLLSHPNYLIALLTFLLGGALIVLFRVMLIVSMKRSYLILMFPILMSYFWVPGLKQNYIFWTSDPGINSNSNELRILALNDLVLNVDLKKLEPVLEQPISDDLRVAKWQVSCMGVIYLNGNAKLKAKAVKWLDQVLENYHNYPFGFRYKMIESMVKVDPHYEKINELCKVEKHVYTRWYAENFGIGI